MKKAFRRINHRMKQILTFIKLYKPWLFLLQLTGFFTLYSTSNLVVSLLVMLACSFFTAVLIRVFPNKNLYYLYNLGYSFASAYSIATVLNILLFAGVSGVITLIIYA